MLRATTRTHTRATRLVLAACAAATLCWSGCRGDLSPDPPIHLNPNMDQQNYLEPQEPSKFWKDGRGMRPQVKGTIARGELRDNIRLHKGLVGPKKYTKKLPVKLTEELLNRGQQRYNIYCRPCHGRDGTGKYSAVRTKGMAVPPTSYLVPRLRAMPVGYFFYVMSNGVRTMQSYAAQIPVRDRWAIAAYVRALQIAGSQPYERVRNRLKRGSK